MHPWAALGEAAGAEVQELMLVRAPPPFDTSAHSPKADFAGSGPLVRFGKPD